MAETVGGKFGGLFFESDVVNKWLHCLPIYDALILPYAGSDVRMREIGVSGADHLLFGARLWALQLRFLASTLTPNLPKRARGAQLNDRIWSFFSSARSKRRP
jgi:hypothetical protein